MSENHKPLNFIEQIIEEDFKKRSTKSQTALQVSTRTQRLLTHRAYQSYWDKLRFRRAL